jgi:hypothetical protein
MDPTRIDRVLGFEHGLPPVYGLVIAVFGLAFLLFGWRLHRITIIVVGLIVGAFIGQLIARWIQVGKVWGILIGGSSLALLADPLYKVIVFILAGGALGVLLGEIIRVSLFEGGFVYAFVFGFLVGGVLSVWRIRILVILSTSFLGAYATLWGLAVAIGLWFFPMLVTFHLRHRVISWIILGLTFVVGCIFQISICPGRRQHDLQTAQGAEDMKEE